MKVKQKFAGRNCELCCASLMICAVMLFAPRVTGQSEQTAAADTAMQERIRTLSDAVDRLQAQVQQSQHELAELKEQLASLRTSAGLIAVPDAGQSQPAGAADLAVAVAELREAQAMQATQIATLDQAKVETASKYPLKLSGMIVMNGFVNTRRMDVAATPTVALSGSGSTGVSVRQTIIGLDVNGPNVFGARTHGDLRLDMNAAASGSGYSGGYTLGLLRLRTAHVDLNWDRTQAFFALDRALLSPETPSSLTAVAEPALAWSGNLWAWNPQAGISYNVLTTRASALRTQAALIDVVDPPPLFSTTQSGTYAPPSTSELSRWPGVEGRIAYEDVHQDSGLRLGVSGYFAPHRTSSVGYKFDSWAGAADFQVPVSRYTQFSGSAYWGSALGGLGAGAYKDYVARSSGGEFYYRVLDDHGGWVQWKQKTGEQLEFNEAFGIDNVPAGQLRPYAFTTPVSYYNLTRNRTFTGNVIYSPSAYLLFSLEYRRIMSSYVTAPTMSGDVIGVGAGYKF